MIAITPRFEPLEELTLLSASILGTVWGDPGGTGVRTADSPGVAGQTVFLDLNGDHQLDGVTTTVAGGSTAILPASGQLGAVVGGSMASLPVQGLPPVISGLVVNMDLTNNGTSPVQVGVISPLGQTVPDFPTLFAIQPGEHFVGSFDQNATKQVTLASRPLAPGTYVPQQLFTPPNSHIVDGDPNGTWGLTFSGDVSGLVLKSWSLTFSLPDPSTQTDANGSYTFSDLGPGTYQVDLIPGAGAAQTSPAGGSPQAVSVADGQTAGGVDFGVRPASRLTTTSFSVGSPAASWGQSVTINYTVTNQGAGDAPAFDAGLYLSSDGPIRTTGPLLQTLHFDGLAAGAAMTRSVTVHLPASPPSGFGTPSTSYVGLFIDPAHALSGNDPALGSNQGLGIDEAPLAVTPNGPVASGPGVQQMPSIAVDPADPGHLVSVYMDNSLVSTGYAGLGVAVSHDGGTTWQHGSIPLPAGFEQGAATPTVRFDAAGRVAVSFMAATFLGPDRPGLTNPDSNQRLDGFESNNGIFVAHSSDGGLTWGTPVAVDTFKYQAGGAQVPFDFSPNLAIDTYATLPGGQPNPYAGSLYVTWVRAFPSGQLPGVPTATGGTYVMFAVSHDGGATWTTEMQTDPTTGASVSAIQDPTNGDDGAINPGKGFANDPQVSVGPEGDIYVSMLSSANFDVFHSSDGGVSFRPPDYDNQLGLPFQGLLNLPDPSLFPDAFRTLPVRDIAADPTHPGRVYITEAEPIDNYPLDGTVDSGDILFAYSNDYGQTWQTQFKVGRETTNLGDLPPGENDTFLSVLNDDNSGRSVAFDTAQQLNTEVLSGQALPSLTVDAQGRIAVIWYDTRRDPLGQQLDVFGTVSTDGGLTFSPNFRVTDTTFDPNVGGFADANGQPTDYIGDRIGVAASGGAAYAVWTDTRSGDQDVYFQRFGLTPSPAPLLDRLAPNFTPQTAAGLGQVTAQLIVPALVATPGQDRWFSLQAGASGDLVVSATAAPGAGSALSLELTDAQGNPLPAVVTPVLDPSGAVSGVQAVVPSLAGQTYLVHVTGSARTPFSLTLGSLTADLGTSVQGSQAGNLGGGGLDVYRLVAGVNGSLSLTLTPGADAQGSLALQVLAADGQTVLASGPSAGTMAGVPQTITLAVSRGQVFLLEVSGAGGDPNAQGSYRLDYVNHDQYESAGATSLFLPTNGSPASVAVAALSGGSTPDLIVSSTSIADPVEVLRGNANGTFQAPRQYDVGPGLSGTLYAGYRQIGVADFNGDGSADVVVPNFRAGDVSLLLNNGDGSFQPQRRFDAVSSPDSLVTGDFNGDGKADLAALQNYAQLGGVAQLAIMVGRGDGTLRPAQLYPTAFSTAGPMVVGDFTGSGIEDIIVFSKDQPFGQLFLGNGDGTFRNAGLFSTGEDVWAAEAVKLPGQSALALITTAENTGNVYVIPGNGDGTFGAPQAFLAQAPTAGNNVGVNGLAVVGIPTTVSGSARAGGLATVAGQPGVYVTAAPRVGQATADLIFMPALLDAQGRFTGLGAPEVQGQIGLAGKLAAFNENGRTDILATDSGGVRVFYGLPLSLASGGGSTGLTLPPNTTPAAARDLGGAPHLLTLSQAIVAGYEDSYNTYRVPVESDRGSGDEVIDVSAVFQDVAGAGLQMEVLDASGRVLGSGANVRARAAQGSVLTIHVFGQTAADGTRGTGAYTLDLDVLPQLVSVQALSVLPGAPATSLVLTFQGDRLDAGAAQDPANYTVTWLGPDGERVIPIATDHGQSPVYDPGANLDVASGLAYPTAVHQTVTLLFDQPLPAGSYRITLSPRLGAAAFSASESESVSGSPDAAAHPLVSRSDALGTIKDGVEAVVPDLIAPSGQPANLGALAGGTTFLTQLQSDLSAILDAAIKQNGDDPGITAALNAQIRARFGPLYAAPVGPPSASYTPPSFTVIWFDPVSIDLQSPQGQNLSYNLSSNEVANGLGQTFVSVGGNVEMVVLANAAGAFNVGVSDVPSSARGGAVELSASGIQTEELTGALRGGATSFMLQLEDTASTTGPTAGVEGGSSGGVTGQTSGGGAATQAGALSSQAVVSLLSTTLLGTPLGGAGASSAGHSSEEAATAAESTGPAAISSTSVTQSRATTAVPQSTSSGPEQSTADQLAANGLAALRPAFLSTLQLVKKLMSRFNGVVDAMGFKQKTSALRLWRDLLENLLQNGGAAAGDGADMLQNVLGARPASNRPAPGPAIAEPAPMPSPPPDPRALDRGVEGVEPIPGGAEVVGVAGSSDGPVAYLAAAFLASGLSQSRLRELPRRASPRGRKPHPGRPE